MDVPNLPAYTARDAAHLTWQPRLAVRFWTRPRGGHPPLITARGALSFINLVELHMLSAFRHVGRVPAQKLHQAVSAVVRRHPTEPHPLATRRFWMDGTRLIIDELCDLVHLNESEEKVQSRVVRAYTARVQWRGNSPRRMFPFTTRPEMESLAGAVRTIVVDPQVAFGRPVVAGTRISARILFERFAAGETIHALAKDYDLELPQVEDAIRCETALLRG